MGKHSLQVVTSDSPLESEPDIDKICDHVSNGGTLANFCNETGMSFGAVNTWIKENNYRNGKYKDAVACRQDWATQHLCSMVMEIARFDHKSVLAKDGVTFLPMSEWPPEARFAISELEVVPGTNVVKVKFTPRLKAIEMIGKTMGMFSVPVNIKADQTLADLVLGSMKKKDES